jgi:hypothetical protein
MGIFIINDKSKKIRKHNGGFINENADSLRT